MFDSARRNSGKSARALWSILALALFFAPVARGDETLVNPFNAKASGFELQLGPSRGVLSLAFSPDGKLLAGGEDGGVRVWEVASGEVKYILPVSGEVTALSFSPDSRTLAAINGYLSATAWDMSGGETIFQAREHELKTYWRTVQFSLDGVLCATTSFDKIVIRDAATGQVRKIIDRKSLGLVAIVAAGFSPDGKSLFVVDMYGPIRIVQWESEPLQFQVIEAPYWSQACAFSPDKKVMVRSTMLRGERSGGLLELWDIASGKMISSLHEKSSFNAFAFAPDSQSLLFSASQTASWNLRTFEVENLLPLGGPKALAISPDGSTLASGGFRSVSLRDAQTGAMRREMPRGQAPIEDVVIAPDGSTLLSKNSEGRVLAWRLPDGKVTTSWQSGGVLKFSLDGAFLAEVGGADIILRAAREDFKEVRAFKGAASDAFCFSPDGKRLAALVNVYAGHAVRIWSTLTGEVETYLSTPDMAANESLFAPDGQSLLVSDKQNLFALWDIKTRSLRWKSRIEKGAILSLAWSPDGKRIALLGGTWDDILSQTTTHVEIRSVVTGELETTLAELPADLANAHYVHADLLALTSQTGEVRFWSLRRKRSIRLIQALGQKVAFDAQSKILAAFGASDSIRLWDRKGRLLATLQPLQPLPPADSQTVANWISHTPEGFYQSSDGASRFMRWRAQGKAAPDVATLTKTFLQPQQVRASIAVAHASDGADWQLAPRIALKIEAGEIRLDGKVVAIDGEQGRFILDAISFTLQSGRSKPIAPSRTKTVVIAAKSFMQNRDGEMTLGALRIGDVLSVVGKDRGSGGVLPARVVDVSTR